MTGAYAVGDVTHGQNQTAIALGDGARVGVAIHEDIRRFPRQAPDPGDVGADEAPRRRQPSARECAMVRERDTHAGLREPPPDR